MIKMILAGAASAVVVGVVALKSDMACQYSPVDISWANSCENIQKTTPLSVVSVDVNTNDSQKNNTDLKDNIKETAVKNATHKVDVNGETPSKTGIVADTTSVKNVDKKDAATLNSNSVDKNAPSIDIARVEPDGSTLVAGRGAPLSKIILKNADKIIGETMSNETGEWVIIADNPIMSDSATLSLLAILPDGKAVESPNELMISLKESDEAKTKPEAVVAVEEVVMLAENKAALTNAEQINNKAEIKDVANNKTVNAVKNTVSEMEKLAADKSVAKVNVETSDTVVETPVLPPVKVAANAKAVVAKPTEIITPSVKEADVKTSDSEPDKTVKPTKVDAIVQEVAELPNEKIKPVKVKPETQPLVVLTEKGKGSKVLQGAGVGNKNNKMTFNSLDFNTNGEVIFSGDAKANEIVRVYVNNKFVGEAKADENGRWSLDQSYIMMSGGNSMRFDQVDDKGSVISRRETKITMPKMNQKAALAARKAAKFAKATKAKTPTVTVTALEQAETSITDKNTMAVAKKAIDKVMTTNDDTDTQPTDTIDDVKQTKLSAIAANESVADKSVNDKKQVVTEITETVVKASDEKTNINQDVLEVATEDAAKKSITDAVANPKKVRAIIIWGDNLWNISRKIYGKGELYTTIFKANTHQIRDPNLIYPGQVFILPENIEIQ